MSALEILKNIFVNPRQAFQKEALEETLEQALLTYLALATLSGVFIFPWIASRSSAMNVPWVQQHARLFGFGTMVFAAPFFLIEIWLVQFFSQNRGAPISFRSLLSGRLWIGVALMFPASLFQILFTSSKWATWVTFPWYLILMVLCIQALSGFDTKRAAVVQLLALAALYGSILALTTGGCIIFALTFGLRHH